MDRKILVAGLSALAVMIVGIVVLVTVLFGDSSAEVSTSKKSEPLFCAVPSNAVAVAKFSDIGSCVGRIAVPQNAGGACVFVERLSSAAAAGDFPGLSRKPFAVAMTYSKKIVPLFIFDAGKSGDPAFDAEAEKMSGIAAACGLHFTDCDCSRILSVDEKLKNRRLLFVSPSENLVGSSLRHLNDGVSVYDAKGFAEVQGRVSDGSCLYVSVSDTDQILPEILGPAARKCSRFLTSFSGWAGFGLSFTDSGAELRGTALQDRQTDFIEVLSELRDGKCDVFRALPAHTLMALSLPADSPALYREAYDAWLDRQMKLDAAKSRRTSLGRSGGVSPADWFYSLQPGEVAVTSFRRGNAVLKVDLVRGGKIADSGAVPFDKAGFLASLFGNLFALEDESFCASVGGWLATGSRDAVETWLSGMESGSSLHSVLCDAGLKSSIPESGTVVSYFSPREDSFLAESVLNASASKAVASRLAGHDDMPVFMCMSSGRKGPISIESCICAADLKKPGPKAGGDVHVAVPEGPFTVKNCATGKDNTLMQNPDLSISLRDQDGKVLWTVPFQEKICGTVTGIDYFANGKIQFLFAAGTKVWLLDRLGNFVRPFPLDLGKKIVLGPAVFDFNGTKKYNILVLHGDNTIRMYNLQGKVPGGWTDITSDDTIVSLPERVVSGDKSVWNVRTARQTSVFPFMGGAALPETGVK